MIDGGPSLRDVEVLDGLHPLPGENGTESHYGDEFSRSGVHPEGSDEHSVTIVAHGGSRPDLPACIQSGLVRIIR